MIEFSKPELVLLIPFFIALTFMSHYFAQKIKKSLEVFHYPPTRRLIRIAERKNIRKNSWRGTSLALKIALITVITFSLAGPTYLGVIEVNKSTEIPMVGEKDIIGGIVLAVDVSSSMSLRDVAPSRFEAVKNLLLEFVRNASEKVRFGVVAFDSEIKNSTSLAEDRERLVSFLEKSHPTEGLLCIQEFTDIGYGLQTAVNMLAPYTSLNNSCAIILISDGFSNYGYPDPFTSVSIAVTEAVNEKIPIHAVHIAKTGLDSNPQLLEWIADSTNGKFMTSESTEELRTILDTLAKYQTPTNAWSTVVEIKTTIPQRIELGHAFMFGVLIVLLLLWVGNYRHYKTWF